MPDQSPYLLTSAAAPQGVLQYRIVDLPHSVNDHLHEPTGARVTVPLATAPS